MRKKCHIQKHTYLCLHKIQRHIIASTFFSCIFFLCTTYYLALSLVVPVCEGIVHNKIIAMIIISILLFTMPHLIPLMLPSRHSQFFFHSVTHIPSLFVRASHSVTQQCMNMSVCECVFIITWTDQVVSDQHS